MTVPSLVTNGGGSGSSATSVAFNYPANQNGDILVVGFYKETSDAVSVGATGFAELTGFGSPWAHGTTYWDHVLWKRLSGTDSGTYTFTWTNAAWRVGAWVLLRGCDTGPSVINAANTYSIAETTSGSHAVTASSVNTTVPDCFLFVLCTCYAGGAWTSGTATLLNNTGDDAGSGQSSFAGPGATGTLTLTCSTAHAVVHHGGETIAIAPLGSGPTTITKTGTPVTFALQATRTQTGTPVTTALLRTLTRTATPVTISLQSLVGQHAVPVSLEANPGLWTDQSGSSLAADLVAAVATAGDGLYIQSPAQPVNASITFHLGSLSPPQAGTRLLKGDWYKDAAGGAIDYTVNLRNHQAGGGGSLIQSFSAGSLANVDEVSSEIDLTETIDPGDWSNIDLEIIANQSG